MANMDSTVLLMDKLGELYDGDQSSVAGYLMGMVFLYVNDKDIENHILNIHNEIAMKNGPLN